ncbi:MAG: divalent-cation tolerance protein CutA [Nitrospinae bacterium]|nr:divalent-cation tolerance protein CutA [Nitrospinota bacterium]
MSLSRFRVVFITAPDETVATGLATALVEERLAACVNLVPGVRSIYRWEDAVVEDREWLMIVKTTADRLERLIARATALHPYDTPEVIALPVETGAAGYLAWLADSCRP